MSGMKLEGIPEIKKLMEALGPAIAKRAGVVGVRKGAIILRRELKASSPKRSGTLQKEWMYKKLRSGPRSGTAAYVVRLRSRQYYKVLEFGSKKGEPTHPFAEATLERVKRQAMKAIVDGTRTALAQEAGKVYAKSQRLSRR